MGYPFRQKAYKLLNLETHQMFTSRDVIFYEQVLPYHSFSSNGSTFFPQSQSFSAILFLSHLPFTNKTVTSCFTARASHHFCQSFDYKTIWQRT